MLEEGFAQARAGDPRAGDTLELFLHHFPTHPRQNEARLALAELAYQDGDLAGAARYLQVANTAAPAAETAEHAAYLAIFLADAETPRSRRRRSSASRRNSSASFPHSPLLPEVRMKLGQVYFRTGDHANAETQFTLLAQESPGEPVRRDGALSRRAGRRRKWIDAGAVDRALRLFDEVVKRDGPLKLYARQQQAIVQSKLGKENEAVASTTPSSRRSRRRTPNCAPPRSAAKGDNLALLGRKDPQQLEAAIAVYDFLAALPEVTPAWRNQALYKKGKALEQLKRQPEALTAYYDVLEKSAAERPRILLVLQSRLRRRAPFRATGELEIGHRHLPEDGEARRPARGGGEGAVEPVAAGAVHLGLRSEFQICRFRISAN